MTANKASAALDPMVWLAEGLPLSLLFDLLEPHGPDSAEINRRERPSPPPLISAAL